MRVVWTPQAKEGLKKVIDYLDENWSENEVINLENRILFILNLIIKFPKSYPKSKVNSPVRKVIVDKNNYIIYRINLKKKTIEIINFKGTKQKPI